MWTVTTASKPSGILPISKPVLASAAVVNPNFVWNEFIFALVFLGDKVHDRPDRTDDLQGGDKERLFGDVRGHRHRANPR